ncbi:MAG: hypothetical protein J5982_00405 [Bacilli bacterium]|nr:hypothetical protein [Bacilli bacterium]
MMGYDEAALTGLLAGLGFLLVIIVLLLIAWAVFAIIGQWKLFVKAGQPGWKSIIPFYNTYTLCEMVGLNWYWFLLAIAPTIISVLKIESLTYIGSIALVFANVMICYNMSKKLHKDTGWIVLAVLFNGFVLPIAGYSKTTTWDKDAVVTPNAFFDKKEQ